MAYAKKLTDKEINERMVELRNLRLAHARDREQIEALKNREQTTKTRVS